MHFELYHLHFKMYGHAPPLQHGRVPGTSLKVFQTMILHSFMTPNFAMQNFSGEANDHDGYPIGHKKSLSF
jgi:hypothetical protein